MTGQEAGDQHLKHLAHRPNLSYAQSKLADLMLSTRLAAVAAQRGWDFIAAAAHPGFTRRRAGSATLPPPPGCGPKPSGSPV